MWRSVSAFYEWPPWEGLLRHLLFALVLYATYALVTMPVERKLSNILLYALIVAVIALLQHTINHDNGQPTTYTI